VLPVGAGVGLLALPAGLLAAGSRVVAHRSPSLRSGPPASRPARRELT
jgi:hypothetical protein